MTKNKKNSKHLIGKKAGFGVLLFLVFFGSLIGGRNASAATPPAAGAAAPAAPAVCVEHPEFETKSIILPACVYYEGMPECEATKGCRNINVFLELLVKVTNLIFAIVGGVALVMFVFGGYVLLTSAGISENVTKGKTIITSAVIGLLIVFTAQLGVQFLLKTVTNSSTNLLVNTSVTAP